jgi:hypothetical protein
MREEKKPKEILFLAKKSRTSEPQQIAQAEKDIDINYR